MDQYMRDNKIDGVPSKETKTEPAVAVAAGEEVVSDTPKAGKDAVKAVKKAAEGKTKAKPEATDKPEAAAH